MKSGVRPHAVPNRCPANPTHESRTSIRGIADNARPVTLHRKDGEIPWRRVPYDIADTQKVMVRSRSIGAYRDQLHDLMEKLNPCVHRRFMEMNSNERVYGALT